jgi:hypothetical protein
MRIRQGLFRTAHLTSAGKTGILFRDGLAICEAVILTSESEFLLEILCPKSPF